LFYKILNKRLPLLCEQIFNIANANANANAKNGGGNSSSAVTSIDTSAGKVKAKKYVFCTGINTDRFFPMLPMWGVIREYAFNSKAKGLFGSSDIIMSTLPKPAPGQQSYVVVIENKDKSRTLRLGGGAEVSASKPDLSVFAPILDRVGGHGKPLRDWIGCRAVSPDGAPIIGLMPDFSNVYVNCGQSFWGWTLSFGSAEVLADHMVHGKPLPKSFNPSRFI
jgi:glycine/D-amino acid oxidase-like deaminating enzyme